MHHDPVTPEITAVLLALKNAAAPKQLDAFMHNFYKSNAAKLREWHTASHVVRKAKSKNRKLRTAKVVVQRGMKKIIVSLLTGLLAVGFLPACTTVVEKPVPTTTTTTQSTTLKSTSTTKKSSTKKSSMDMPIESGPPPPPDT